MSNLAGLPLSPSPSPPQTAPDRAAPARSSAQAASGSFTHSRKRKDPPAHTIADVFGYEELFIRILSFLSPTELALVQGVSISWQRMTLDPQLWKRLYLARYPHPHHSRLVYKDDIRSRTSTPKRLRPISRLPSRVFPPPSPTRSAASSSPTPSSHAGHALALDGERSEVGYGVRNDGVDWKVMLRLGINWSNGNVHSEETISLPPSPSPSNRSLETEPGFSLPSRHSSQHIALSPAFIFTSNPDSPLVHVHRASSYSSKTTAAALGIIPPPPGWSSPHRPDNITAVCADQSVSVADEGSIGLLPARLAVFYQSGGFVILRVARDVDDKLNWHRACIFPAQSRPRSIRNRATSYTPLQGDPVVLAVMHFPILLTCTVGFHLSTYEIPLYSGEVSRPRHLSTMHSDVSFHPATLSLLPDTGMAATASSSYTAALTYCTPLYPASWTVAVQEFAINQASSAVHRGECYHVGRGDDDFALDVWPRRISPIAGVRGGSAVGVGTDGRWCVLAGNDNQIQVYSLPTPSPSPSPSKTPPIVHSQTLLAHSSAVTSISLVAGRCVSGGRDGRILVWELDEHDTEDDVVGRDGRTIGYVEVKQGGRRWRGPSGPKAEDEEGEEDSELWVGLPHPASISSAARSFFLPRPPDIVDERPPPISHLAFDEEKIVGLVKTGARQGEVMKVWSFNG